ncbi:YkvA family protein [Streptomyces sp. NBC_00083]|uniref:YkvA family protein n=1 Tax=Streptomyces sp. NBC_00083 TaxID=2975647 RepID=UPI002259DE55|nr:YkvA family protein [Streptomyces sp. NBC_00083]MCX5384281.1 YkvA family protein [Streptomyces sp. NBC_00083]
MSTEMTVVLILVGLALLAAAVVAVVLTARLVRARKILQDAGIPLTHKAAFWGALAYVISPVDLLPDPIYLDDIGVLLLALRALHMAAAAPRGVRELSGEWTERSAGRTK